MVDPRWIKLLKTTAKSETSEPTNKKKVNQNEAELTLVLLP